MGAEREEKEEKEEDEGHKGRGDMWRLLVKLVQYIWNTGEILRQILRTIIVLIPKGNSGDFREIGLLEVIWKRVERVHTQQTLEDRATQLSARVPGKMGARDGHHGGEACPAAGLSGASAIVLLFCIFLDLKKAYDAIDRGRCLDILEDCGVGPWAQRLIEWFWEFWEMACRASGYYGRVFKASRG